MDNPPEETARGVPDEAVEILASILLGQSRREEEWAICQLKKPIPIEE